MTALGEVGTKVSLIPALGATVIQVVTAATVVGGTDTLTVDLTDFGCTNIHGILGFDETTTGSVVVNQQPTTAVSGGTLTITTTGSETCVKTFYVFAY